MTFNSNKSFVGENIRLHNGRSYGNDVRAQFVGGQEAIGTSSNVSSAYKTVKSTGKNEPKNIQYIFCSEIKMLRLRRPTYGCRKKNFNKCNGKKSMPGDFSDL